MAFVFKKALSPFAVEIALSFAALALASCGAAYKSRTVPPPAVLTQTASPVATVATTDLVRITSINGTATPTHASEVYIHPGDVVTLSADSFLAAQNFAPANLPVEAFQWSSTINAQDICNAANSTDCLLTSNFQVNDYGVAFYSPYNMPESVQISVRSAQNNEVDSNGNPVSDHIVVHNMDFVAGQAAVTPVMVMDPLNYPSPSLNENTALVGMGRWVTVNSVRYFTPYTYITPGETEWMPYRHGYWAWENTAGWTWISYDPWGWMTDHYGVWRHHATYGWLWLPFEKHQYVPHAVTWMDQGESIGWFPYHEPSRALYVGAFAEGFDDGYWGGALSVGVGFGEAGYRFHPGFAIVNRRDITNVNIVGVLINRALIPDAITIGMIRGAYDQKHFFPIPGGEFGGSRVFIEQFALRPAPITIAESIHTKGGAIFIQPRGMNPIPPESRAFLKSLPLDGHPMSIGSVARANQGVTHFLPPATGGRGIAAPPLLRNEQGVVTGRLEVETKHPTQFDKRNPLGALNLGAPKSQLPMHASPAFDPHSTTERNPPPMIPLSAPRGEGHAAPAPAVGGHDAPVGGGSHATPASHDVPALHDPSVGHEPEHVPRVPNVPHQGPAQRPHGGPDAPAVPGGGVRAPGPQAPTVPQVPAAPRPQAPTAQPAMPKPQAPAPQVAAPKPQVPAAQPVVPKPQAPAAQPVAPKPQATPVVAPKPQPPAAQPVTPKPQVAPPQAPARETAPAPQQARRETPTAPATHERGDAGADVRHDGTPGTPGIDRVASPTGAGDHGCTAGDPQCRRNAH